MSTKNNKLFWLRLSQSSTKFDHRIRHAFAITIFWVGSVILLNGCMQALQTGALEQPSSPVTSTVPANVATDPVSTPTISEPTLAATDVAELPTTEVTAISEEPTLEVQPTSEPTDTTPIIQPTMAGSTSEAVWRAQQNNRQVFPEVQQYSTTYSELWWYDPVNQTHVLLGSFAGPFQAQAEFTLARDGSEALEVPYQVNQSYGLTALSPALLERIVQAGYSEWIETYVYITPEVTLQ